MKQAQEREALAIEVLPILGESAATIEPRDDRESFHLIGAPDDFGFDVGQDARQAVVECRPLIGRVGKELVQERMHSKHGGEQHDAAVAVLDISAMDDRVEKQSQRIYQNVALLALDLLARIIAMRIDPAP